VESRGRSDKAEWPPANQPGAESGRLRGDFSESEALFKKIFERGKRVGDLGRENRYFAEESVKKL
jgi:hypothetical protein